MVTALSPVVLTGDALAELLADITEAARTQIGALLADREGRVR